MTSKPESNQLSCSSVKFNVTVCSLGSFNFLFINSFISQGKSGSVPIQQFQLIPAFITKYKQHPAQYGKFDSLLFVYCKNWALKERNANKTRWRLTRGVRGLFRARFRGRHGSAYTRYPSQIFCCKLNAFFIKHFDRNMKFFVVIDIRAIKQRASFNEVNPLFGFFLVTQEDSPQNKKRSLLPVASKKNARWSSPQRFPPIRKTPSFLSHGNTTI